MDGGNSLLGSKQAPYDHEGGSRIIKFNHITAENLRNSS